MPRLAILIASLFVCSLAADAAWAAPIKITEQQVRTVCGKNLQESSGALGCEKKCGKSTCTYGCLKDKGGKGKDCSGQIVYLVGGNPPVKPDWQKGLTNPGLLDAGPAGGSQQLPSATGNPIAPAGMPGRIN